MPELTDECIDQVAGFGHRDVEAMIVSAVFLPPGSSPEQVAAAGEKWAPIAAQGCGAYAGFVNSDAPADLAAIYPADTLKRLVEVKRAWDPDNVFRRNFNVRP